MLNIKQHDVLYLVGSGSPMNDRQSLTSTDYLYLLTYAPLKNLNELLIGKIF